MKLQNNNTYVAQPQYTRARAHTPRGTQACNTITKRTRQGRLTTNKDACSLSSLREAVHTHTFKQHTRKQAEPPSHPPTRRNTQRSITQQGGRGAEPRNRQNKENKEDNKKADEAQADSKTTDQRGPTATRARTEM